ncbi:MAG: hypothetical protein KAJ14_08925 [Candidatus Omnitrophica bacterium]|nr:hypothetical protein [Candidatus Omnitrophota bacterium]MCK5493219.1 hypothetical protein [Candidatus Omnitrophota bacterium]
MTERNTPPYEDEIDLVDYIKVIYKYRKFIVIFVLICTFFSGLVSLSKPKIYQATATFFPMDINASYDFNSESFSPRQLNIKDLIISILESRKMADKIIQDLELQKIWDIKVRDNLRVKLKGITKITLEKNGLIKLSVKLESPEISAKIANSYINNLSFLNNELELGVERKIVQIIDRAIVPETRMPRGTKKNVMLAGMASFMVAIFLSFFIEFIKNSDIKKRLKEIK